MRKLFCAAMAFFLLACAVPALSGGTVEIRLSDEKIQIAVGERYNLYIISLVTETDGDVRLEWSSDDENIARVTVAGAVLGVGEGETAVHLKAADGSCEAVCFVSVSAQPQSVTIPPYAYVEVGKSVLLEATVFPDVGETILWTSSTPEIATVDENGTVWGRAPGQCVIAATCESQPTLRAECAFTVSKPKLEKIVPSVETLELGIDELYSLSCALLPLGAEYALTYASDAPEIASISEDGTVTAIAKGNAILSVSAMGIRAQCAVSVFDAPKKVQVDPARCVLGVGESVRLSPVLPEGARGGCVFSSGNETVATVDENGIVTAVARGSATITVKTYNRKSTRCAVTVKKAPEEISFPEETLSLRAGDSAPLAARLNKGAAGRISYAVSDENVLSYADGVLTAHREGSATLFAESYNGIRASVLVTISPAPTSIICEDMVLGVKQKSPVFPKLLPEGAVSDYTVTSSDTACVSVQRDGTLRAKREGTCTVTVTAYNGVSVSFSVTVLPAPKNIALWDEEITLSVGESHTVSAILPEGTMSSVAFSTKNPAVATVDENGTITAVGQGKTTLTAVTANGKKATCIVFVK
ncbi:MAG: Ig-like domain-containing protein [Christensenellales bacterium]|jgi:uncharacterized protein YjdB